MCPNTFKKFAWLAVALKKKKKKSSDSYKNVWFYPPINFIIVFKNMIGDKITQLALTLFFKQSLAILF